MLQELHDELKTYKQNPPPPPSTIPVVAMLTKKPAASGLGKFFASFFDSGDTSASKAHVEEKAPEIDPTIPKGMYLYGDVGTGKR